MNKSNLELFKQAIHEGLSNKIDSITNSCTEEIVCSEKHEIAMRTILHGKIGGKSTTSLKARRVIAILVAAALLLTSCGIIFRNEIREIFESIYDFFVAVSYTDEDLAGIGIEEVYELGYLPEGYYLEKSNKRTLCIQYKFANQNGDYFWFEQKSIDGTDFVVDTENGYSQINEISNHEIYYRFTNKNHFYVWNDGKYSMYIKSSIELSTDEILLILNGITAK